MTSFKKVACILLVSLGVLLAVAALAASSACGNTIKSLRARDQLNKGVNAFKNGMHPQAVEHFKQAVDMDPGFLTARLYLATAYMSQYVPGAESEENQRNADAAMKGFLEVLDRDNKNALAVESIGSLCFNQKKLDDAKKWYLKLIDLDKQNKQAYYTVGVINWTKSYTPRMEARARTGMKPEEPGPIKDKKARETLKEQSQTIVQEGIDMLQRALEIDPEYDDAMAYMNLLFREKADIAETVEENKSCIAQAEQWVQKTLETKKKKKGEGALAASKG